MELVEPFPAWAWPLAWEWYRQSRLPDDFSPKTPEQFVELSSGRYTRTFGVIKDGLLGGVVAFEQASPALAIMHVLFAKSLYRRFTGKA